MRTLDLRQQRVTVNELLRFARTESVRIVAEEGDEFILEVADVFECEVAELSQSETFMVIAQPPAWCNPLDKKGCGV